MILSRSKMQRHLVQLLLCLLLLLIFLPHPGQAVATPKPKSEAFWRKFCGFFCPFQLSCDSDVYLSSQQQLDLLNSQEFLDILELFPKILIENEMLQHTTLVRLEDHQRDLILLRYKDFFHPRDTLPLARQNIVSKLVSKDEQSFGGIPAAEPPPSHVHLTKGQVQRLAEENQVQEDVAYLKEAEGDLGTPDWNEAESFIRNYVNQQLIRQSLEKKAEQQSLEKKAEQQTFTTTARAKKTTSKRRKNDNVISLDINQLQEQALQTNLNIDQIRQELERLGHKLDLSTYPLRDHDLETYPDPEPVEPEPQRTTELVLEEAPNAQEIISVSEHQNSGDDDDASRTKNLNRISDKRSRNTPKPRPSESNDARTLQRYLHQHRRNQAPINKRLTQTLSQFYDGSSLTSRSAEGIAPRGYDGSSLTSRSAEGIAPRGSKRNSKGLGYHSARGQRRHHRSHLLVHEPGGVGREDGSSDSDADRGVHRRVKRQSRRKREAYKIQLCPAVEKLRNIMLAETMNGTLVQLAQTTEPPAQNAVKEAKQDTSPCPAEGEPPLQPGGDQTLEHPSAIFKNRQRKRSNITISQETGLPFPEVNLGQWFLEEKCLYEYSPIIKGVTCEIRERFVNAVIIPVVNPTQPIQIAKIKVECCMSMYNVELDLNTEPELSTTPQT